MMGKHRVFLALTLLELAALAGLGAWGWAVSDGRAREEQPAKRVLARTLGLTDLALWTEARYTRNPSLADRFAAFEDFPSALDHFPAASIVPAPHLHHDGTRPGS